MIGFIFILTLIHSNQCQLRAITWVFSVSCLSSGVSRVSHKTSLSRKVRWRWAIIPSARPSRTVSSTGSVCASAIGRSLRSLCLPEVAPRFRLPCNSQTIVVTIKLKMYDLTNIIHPLVVIHFNGWRQAFNMLRAPAMLTGAVIKLDHFFRECLA